MKRYIVTIADTDPTLAAQAHAAIVAVPGVEGVEEYEDEEDADFERVWTPFDPPDADAGWTETPCPAPGVYALPGSGPLRYRQSGCWRGASKEEVAAMERGEELPPARYEREEWPPGGQWTDLPVGLHARIAALRDALAGRDDADDVVAAIAASDVSAVAVWGDSLALRWPDLDAFRMAGGPDGWAYDLRTLRLMPTYTVGDEEDGDP